MSWNDPDVPVNRTPSLADQLLAITPAGKMVQNPAGSTLEKGGYAKIVDLVGGFVSGSGSASLTIPVASDNARIAIVACFAGQSGASADGALALSIGGSPVATQPVKKLVSDLATDPDSGSITGASYALPPATLIYTRTVTRAGDLSIVFTAPAGPVTLLAFPLLQG